jgi:hypothetical protein
MNTPRTIRWWCATLLLLQAVADVGCASKAYRYGDFWDPNQYQVVVHQGEPNKRIDKMSDIVSWPGRKLMPDRPDKRKITPETTAKVVEYLEKNDLGDVHVAVRDYQPRDQWRRLRDNKQLPPLSRYTFGTFSVLRYSLFPGPVFGRNSYNPYTNTLDVNSDSPALLLHEAAFAKNVHSNRLPGLYAAGNDIPFVATWHNYQSASDVIGYAQAESDWDLEQESYREVYPRVGSSAGGGMGALVTVWWGGPLLELAGTAAGTVAGRTALAQRERERGRELNETVEDEVTGRVQLASYQEPVEQGPDQKKPGQKRARQSSSTGEPARLPGGPPVRGRRLVQATSSGDAAKDETTTARD